MKASFFLQVTFFQIKNYRSSKKDNLKEDEKRQKISELQSVPPVDAREPK